MKKVLLTILSAALSVFTLAAASTASFDIKAYKLREGSMHKIEITDAIPGSLDTFTSSENGKEIDLSSVRQNLLGQTNIEIADFAEHVIFSWRVWGNTTGRYTVKINFSTFNLQKEENGISEDEGPFIGVRFESGNETFSFPDFNDSVVKDEYGDELGKIEEVSIDAVSELSRYVPSDSPSIDDPISISWNVTGTNFKRWIARGAVAANISTSDFENKDNPNGIYRAYCTVSLESGS